METLRNGPVELQQEFEIGHIAHGGVEATVTAPPVPDHLGIHGEVHPFVFAGRQHAVGAVANKAQVLEILGHDIERRGDDAKFRQSRDGLFQLLRFQPVVGIKDGGIWGFEPFERHIARDRGAAQALRHPAGRPHGDALLLSGTEG